MSNKIVISGAVVADPEFKQISDTFSVLEFPLYDNETRKDRDTGEYKPTGNTLKLKVVLKNDAAAQYRGEIRKGDVWEVDGTITEREYEKKDGTKGRALETTYVNSLTLKWRKDGDSAEEPF